MRKFFFILLASVVVFSLSNCKGGGVDATTFHANDTIPKSTALAMYDHYMDSTVDKSPSAIIRQIYPPVSSLHQILKTKHLIKVNFLVAAYLDTDPIVARRNKPMILLQLTTETSGVTTVYYYDLESATKDASPTQPYCPPPPCPPLA